MKIEQLRQLLLIVEKGSMNEAAKDLFIARSSLSAAMKNLEAELGEQIFSRHSTGVILTPFGSNVYHMAKEICDRIDYLKSVSSEQGPTKLHIASMYCSMANAAVAEFLNKHYNDKEHYNVAIEETALSTVLQSVTEGLCEIGVITLFSENQTVTLRKLEAERIEFHEVAQRQLGAIVGPKNPLFSQGLDYVDIEDLWMYPHLENYATPTDHSWEHRFSPSNGYWSNYLVSDLALALRIVSDTDAVMIDAFDKDIYLDLYAKNDYKFIPIRDYPKCRTGWIKKKNVALSPIAEAYIEIFSEIAKSAI